MAEQLDVPSRPIEQAAVPRVFVSYAWTDTAHQKWVVDLATSLQNDGIEVMLDVWDLKPGHDKFQFMERMVADPSVDPRSNSLQ